MDGEALKLLVTKGYNLAYGARFLKRVIDEQVKLPISLRWKDGSHFEVTAKNGEVVVEAIAPRLLTAHAALAVGDVA